MRFIDKYTTKCLVIQSINHNTEPLERHIHSFTHSLATTTTTTVTITFFVDFVFVLPFFYCRVDACLSSILSYFFYPEISPHSLLICLCTTNIICVGFLIYVRKISNFFFMILLFDKFFSKTSSRHFFSKKNHLVLLSSFIIFCKYFHIFFLLH